MEIENLIQAFSHSRENQVKAIFSTLFIAENKLQTIFDNNVPDITLKQFMLLTMVRQSKEQLTFTQCGKLLGCSRQNIKKLASALERKGFVQIVRNENDVRAASVLPTEKIEDYFENVFSGYIKILHSLFEDYSDEEILHFFQLLMRLYPSIEKIEKEVKS